MKKEALNSNSFFDSLDWHNLTEEGLSMKIEEILKMIPEDVSTIIDVGCGNGAITNPLAQKFDVTGVDRSPSALESVKAKKLIAECNSIPVPASSFDLVLCSELLEHLDNETLQSTVSELDRISKRYLLVTVPNEENPDKLIIQCPQCKHLFNRSHHFRSFSLQSLRSLFPEYIIKHSMTLGIKVRYYHPLVLKVKHRLSNSKSWIPYYWIPKTKRNNVCPKCQNQFYYPFRFNLVAFCCDIVNVLISPKKPYWLIVLMEKKDIDV